MAEYIVEMPFAWIYNEADGTKRESIVRCRDCEHYDDYLGSCLRGNDNGRSAVPDGFCAWGVRK